MASNSPTPSAATSDLDPVNQRMSLAAMDQRNQQQELIKLLAQHFHNQFYQLAGNSGPQMQQPQLNSSNYHHHQAQQQQQHQYGQQATESGLLNQAGLDSLAPSSAGSLINEAHLLQKRGVAPLRPAPQQDAGPRPFSADHQSSNNNNLIDFTMSNQQRRHQINPAYPFNDLNLFNALGLTNNQLVLSTLQQHQQHQQLLLNQTASSSISSTARHYESISDALPGLAAAHRQSVPTIRAKEPGKSSREMLKFSINTILGHEHKGDQQNDPNKMKSRPSRRTHSTHRQASECDQANKLDESQSEDDDHIVDADGDDDDDDDERNDSDSDQSTSNHRKDDLILNQTSRISANNSQAINPINTSNINRQQQQHHQQQRSIPIRNHQNPLGPNQHLPGQFLASNSVNTFPWTVAARGKPRRGMMRRAVFSDSQRVGLEKRFQLQKYISKPDRKKLAEKLGLRDSQVKIWFQNRRMKWRNSKERELLSAGGSREQTLPTRNNPNPDLSDVGETIKRLQQTTATTTILDPTTTTNNSIAPITAKTATLNDLLALEK